MDGRFTIVLGEQRHPNLLCNGRVGTEARDRDRHCAGGLGKRLGKRSGLYVDNENVCNLGSGQYSDSAARGGTGMRVMYL